MKIPELLAPAGDMEKLRIALEYGADAVYLGGEAFGLRALAGNFSHKDLAEAIELTHSRGKKLYLTINAYVPQKEQDVLKDYLLRLRDLPVDAYIVSDPGVLAMIRDIDPERELHLSTQANTTNAAAVRFWQAAGVKRINLARELSLEDVSAIYQQTDVELEIFIHGAMCVAYSGRCLLSSALTGRSANQGACAHPCRWSYALVEETRPGQYMPIETDEAGTFVMNSRDLCLLEQLPQLIQAGAASLKIEGRMKSLYYLAAVTRIYRAALDRYRANPADYACDPLWLDELDKVSHRPYSTGFLFGMDDPQVHTTDSRYRRSHDFVGIVREILPDGNCVVEGRNRFFPDEQLELIGPEMRQETFQVGNLRKENGAVLTVGQPNLRVVMQLPQGARPGDLLRRESSEGKAV